MGDTAVTSVAAGEVKPEKMIFLPILEEGVFRFDCLVDARNAAYPTLSFVKPEERDTTLMCSSNHKLPSYIPTFEYVAGQQSVYFKFPEGTSFTEQVKLVDSLKEQGKGYLLGILMHGGMGVELHPCISHILGFWPFFLMERQWGFLLIQQTSVRLI